MKRSGLIVPVLCLLIAGCTLVPPYHRPDVAMPKQCTCAAAKDEKIATDWWKGFGSEELNGLIKRALTENNDMRAALERIKEARATARITNAALWPAVDASAGASGAKTDSPHEAATLKTGWNGGVNISWEMDLFGANRASSEAARAGIAASIFDHDALALTTMGDVAQGYFNILNLREQVKIAQGNLKITKDVMRI